MAKWIDISCLKDTEARRRFRCPCCQFLLHNAVQPCCGHRLCEGCADSIIQKHSPPLCPLKDCGEEFLLEDGMHVR